MICDTSNRHGSPGHDGES